MRLSPALLLFALAACHSTTTPAERMQQSAKDQRKIAAFPPNGDPHADVVSIDDDAATPANAGANQP